MRKQSWLNLILSMFLILTACQSTPAADIPSAEQSPSSSSSQPELVVPDPTSIPQQSESGKSIAIFEALKTERGQEALEWARMAVEDFNATSSMKVTLVEVDTGGSPATVSTGANELAGNRDVLAVVGVGLASEAMSGLPILDMAGLPIITTSGFAPLTQQGYRGLFRVAPLDDGQGPTAGLFLVEELNASKVFLLSLRSHNGVYYETLNTSFEQTVGASGAAIVGREEITDTSDLAALASTIQASGAEAVFMGAGTAEQALELAQALQDKATIVVNPYAANSALLDVEGIVLLSRLPALPSDLVKRYLDRHGDYQANESLAYIATMAALEAVQRAAESGSLDRGAVREALTQTNGLSGLPGIPITFEPNGDLKEAQFYVLQVENGEFKTIWP